MSDIARRRILQGVVVTGTVVPLAAACGGDGTTKTPQAKDSPAAKETPPEETPSTEPSTEPSEEPTEKGIKLGPASAIPVGGGKLFQKEKVIVTQPAAGDFKAFSAVCPHKQCVLQTIADKRIKCTACHKSEYDFATGEPLKGPNGQPPSVVSALTKKEVEVEDGQVEVL